MDTKDSKCRMCGACLG